MIIKTNHLNLKKYANTAGVLQFYKNLDIMLSIPTKWLSP